MLWNADGFAPTECIALTATAMLAIRLPEKIEKSLPRPAKRTGRTKTCYAREAILRHLEELEDIYLAERRLEAVRSGCSRTILLKKVMRRYGLGTKWTMEIEPAAPRELDKLDKPVVHRILKFLYQRIGNSITQRQIGERLQGTLSELCKYRA